MLRISNVGPANGRVTLRVEGRCVGAWVREFRKTCDEVLEQGCPLRLQLADLEFLDVDGVALLRSLSERGVTLAECPPFIAEQLKSSSTR